MIINNTSNKTDLKTAREIFGLDRFISAEEAWEKLDIECIGSLSKDEYLNIFNSLSIPFSAEELEQRKPHAYLVPIHTFSLTDLQRILIHDSDISFNYKEEEIREQLAGLKIPKPKWYLVDEGPGLAANRRATKPKYAPLLQAALLIHKVRDVNILAKGSICKESIRINGETINPVLHTKIERSKFNIYSFLNLSEVSGSEFVISID